MSSPTSTDTPTPTALPPTPPFTPVPTASPPRRHLHFLHLLLPLLLHP
jgi:hypothetical protein